MRRGPVGAIGQFHWCIDHENRGALLRRLADYGFPDIAGLPVNWTARLATWYHIARTNSDGVIVRYLREYPSILSEVPS